MSDLVELYRKYRPTRLTDVVGQESAVGPLRVKLKEGKVPHVILLTGGSGCGKTTIARILQAKLNCHPADFNEMNCAGDSRGIDTIRELKYAIRRMPRNPGGSRIWLLDEVGATTRDFQQAALKMWEDTPAWVYFFLATNEPDKLLPTVRNRCFLVALQRIPDAAMEGLLRSVLEKECPGRKLGKAVYEKIVEFSQGSARGALQTLERVLTFDAEADQLNCIVPEGTSKDAFEIVRQLLYQKATWAKLAETINAIQETNWEGLRQLVLTCATKECLRPGGNHGWAAKILVYFENPWHYTGKAGLVSACYAALKNRER